MILNNGKSEHIGIKTADGSQLNILETRLEDEAETRTKSLLEQISEYRRIENDPTRSIDSYRTLFEKFPVMIWISGVDAKCKYINKAWYKFTGLAPEHKGTEGWIESIHPEDYGNFHKIYNDSFNSRQPFELEYRLLHCSGVYRRIINIGRPFYDHEGGFEGYLGICFDITDYKPEYEIFKKYKLLFEKTSDIVLFLDMDGRLIEANNAAVRSYGYAREELLSKTVFDLAGNDGKEFVRDRMLRASAEGISFEAVHYRKDGTCFSVEVNSCATEICDKKLLMYVIKDITERKNAEDLLHEYEAKYFSLFANMSEAFAYNRIIYDKNGKPVDFTILEVNKSFEDITGVRREDVAGKRITQVIPYIAEIKPSLSDFFAEMESRGKKARFEFREQQLGKWFSISAYSTEKEYFVFIISDITEQKAAEEEIHKLSGAIEQSSNIVMITNGTGIIEYVNLKFLSITGYSKEEVVGKYPGMLKPYPQSNSLYMPMRDTIIAGIEWKGEILNIKKNGELFWTATSISPIRNSENTITHCLVIMDDISEQKILQEKLSSSYNELQETHEKLKQTQSQLIQREKLAGIGQLAAGIAHEINNPLGYVTSNFDTLKKYFAAYIELLDSYRKFKDSIKGMKYGDIELEIDKINELEKKYNIDFISKDLEELYNDNYDGLERIGRIVLGLRLFSRVDQQNDFAEYNLNVGIINALLVANSEIKHNAVVEKALGDIPVIFANGGQINQVLLNIIINAVQAIKSKRGKRVGTIVIKTYHDEKYVYCDIKDSGIGIPDECVNKIFEPFFTTKPVGEGTGLGLSISYDIIVNKHSGDISVSSIPGKGTKFTIKIPINLNIQA